MNYIIVNLFHVNLILSIAYVLLKKPVNFGLYQNCRGLRTKLAAMNRNVADFDFIFISLSETWLTDSIFSSELGLINYNVFRCDRSSITSVHNRGGGVLIAVQNDVSSQFLKVTAVTLNSYLLKFVIMQLLISCLSVYFPPKSSVDSYKFFISTLENLMTTYPDCSFILSGDFNLPGIYWSNDKNGLTYSTSTSCHARCILESFAYFNFFPVK